MKSLPIPEEAQMRAMIDGSIYELFQDYTENTECVDIRKFITISRNSLIEFLTTHPDTACSYFEKHSRIKSTHDVEKIWKDGSEYITAWMDHGQIRSLKRFKNLSSAVAEHILVSYGMY